MNTAPSTATSAVASATAAPSQRFLLLDGLRGVAAFAIIVDHVPTGAMAASFPGRYLAVDFFFMLSGFVLAHAYGKRLADGWSPWSFMAARLVRLYPLYLAALVMGLALAVFGIARGWHGASMQELLELAPFALLMLPAPAITQWGQNMLYPMNGPAWTLFYELVANVVYALVSRFLTTKVLTGVLAALAIFLTVAVFRSEQPGVSWHWGVWDLGLARALFGFFAGVALYQFKLADRLPQWPALVSAAALIAVVMFPATGVWRHVFDCVALFVILPLIIASSARTSLKGVTAKVCASLGWLSYGVYILQVPTLSYVRVLFAAAGQADMPTTYWTAILVAVLMAAISAALTFAFETPARRFLTRLINRKPVLDLVDTLPGKP